MASESESTARSKVGTRAVLTVLLVAAVGVATIGLPVVNGGMATTAQAAEPSTNVESYDSISQAESELDPADEVYLRDDGSAVLRYDEESDVNQLDLGMDVSEGLVHVLVVDDVEGQNQDLKEGDFSAVLDQNGFSGDGSLVMEQPDQVQDLSVDASGKVTDETNEFQATATGTFQGGSGAVSSVDTSGHITATADRLESSGSVSAEGGMGSAAGEGNSLDVSLEDTSDGYVIDVSQERSVYDWSADQWQTREQAKQTLEQQYGTLAMTMGGSSDIQISSYNFEERESGQHRLEIDFTVEYTGIDEGIERQLAAQLANSEETDLTQSEAETIAAGVTELEIETFEVSMNQNGGSMDAEWDIALANYNEVSLAMVDLAESSSVGEEMEQGSIEDARTAIEAQQAADLQWTLEWDASVEQTSGQQVQLDAEVTSETENWAAYVDELESRGANTQNDVSFSLTADTDGEELSVDAQFEVQAEDLAGQAIDSWAQSAQNSPTMSSDANQFLSALSDSELEVARVDANVADGTVQVEGGAKFENMSAIADTFSDSLSVSGVASETSDGTTSMYVYVDDMGDIDTASATKADLEHLSVVGPETTVHAAGEWDEEFPDVDTAGMSEYLDVESQSSDGNDGGDGDGVPGFGVGAGLAAIAGLLTTLAVRRRA